MTFEQFILGRAPGWAEPAKLLFSPLGEYLVFLSRADSDGYQCKTMITRSGVVVLRDYLLQAQCWIQGATDEMPPARAELPALPSPAAVTLSNATLLVTSEILLSDGQPMTVCLAWSVLPQLIRYLNQHLAATAKPALTRAVPVFGL